jgi:hypothetical protein
MARGISRRDRSARPAEPPTIQLLGAGTFDAPCTKALLGVAMPLPLGWVGLFVRPIWSKTMAREELKWQNIDADAAFKADLEKLLKNEGHMPEDKYLLMSRKGKRLGVAYASTPRGEGKEASLKFKTK